MLSSAAKIYIGRQGNYTALIPGATNRKEILAQAMGRSGGLRAPALRSGEVLLIGFSEDMYREVNKVLAGLKF